MKWLAAYALAALLLYAPASANEALERQHRGISLLALPADPGKTFDTKLIPPGRGLQNIAEAFDHLVAKSPLSARKINRLKQSGDVILVYLPDDLKSANGGENVAAFHPDYLRQNISQEKRKRFLVMIGRHGVKWPRDELAATIAHELVGHGAQHQRGRLARVRPIDAECEAYLYEEIANQDLGLDKRKRGMVGFRRMLEERWCADFKAYQRVHQPKSLKLWDVLNPNVPKLLEVFESYLEHAKQTGITAKAINALKQQVKYDRRLALRGATAERLYQAAVTLRDGGIGTLPDASESFRYFRFAAEKGHVKAWVNIAYMYENGEGVSQNVAKALHWYRKAAEKGHLEAQYRLARHLYRGVGSKKDLPAAAGWAAKAASRGHAVSQNSLGWMYTKGHGVEKDLGEAAVWFKKSAQQGHAQAQLRLGWLHMKGLGVKADNAAAYKWYEVAAKNAQAKAKDRETARLYRNRLSKYRAAAGIAGAAKTVE